MIGLDHQAAPQEIMQEISHFPKNVAIDMGSGQFKLFVGMKNEKGEIETIFEKIETVSLSEDLKNRMITVDTEETLFHALEKLKSQAALKESLKIQATATAAFREAENGVEVLDRLAKRLDMRIVRLEGEEEGAIGFNSVFKFCKECKQDKAIIFESGSGSIQITFKEGDKLESVSLPLGTVPAIRALLENVRGETYDKNARINPVAQREVDHLIDVISSQLDLARKTNAAFFDKLEKKVAEEGVQVIGIGFGGLVGRAIDVWNSEYHMFNDPKTSMTKEEVEQFIGALVDKEDDHPMISSLKSHILANRSIPSVTMLYAVMSTMKFDTIKWQHVPAGSGSYIHFYDND